MAANDREKRQREREFVAKKKVHDRQVQRRRRDNIVIAVIAIVLLIGATLAQIAWAHRGTSPVAKPTATSGAPAASVAENREWTGELTLNGKALGITLDGKKAPKAVASFVTLSKKGFFNGVSCHRLTTADRFKVLQCGDPKGDGTGGPGYQFGPIENAPADNVYKKGVIAMARQGGNADSMGSQFFIVYGDTDIPADNAGGYTVFGTVTSGLETVEKIGADGTADGGSDGKPKDAAKVDKISVK